jgi:NAD(P)-dependent dehydrogenase (short-subunit alcohol dehydrogenase family)
MITRVFVGSRGSGRRLVSQLLARGHQVTATTTSEACRKPAMVDA